MLKIISVIGILTCVLYFAIVILFLITKTEASLTLWEIFTIIGAPVILFVLIELANLMDIASTYRNAMLVFMACNCSLTGLAHIINITVTRKLIAEGINVPDYFRIGYWPSIVTAIDYLGWGFFMGLAFLSVGYAIEGDKNQSFKMKSIVIMCGALCLTGFFGAIIINENLWYLAPLGYGFGTILICLKMLRIHSDMKRLAVRSL